MASGCGGRVDEARTVDDLIGLVFGVSYVVFDFIECAINTF